MSQWAGGVLTAAGRSLQAKIETGTTLTLTKIKLGDGTESMSAVDSLVDLVSPKAELGISSATNEGDVATITGVMSATLLSAGFYAREWGLFAQDPDVGEILYMITIDAQPEWLPASTEAAQVSATYAMNIAVANATNIEVNIDPAGLVDVDMLNEIMGAAERSKAYSVGDLASMPGLPAEHYLRCITAGTTGANTPVLPANIKDGDKITDGTVMWQVTKAMSAAELGYRQPSTAYTVGQIAYHTSLPTGYYLECTTAGTTGSGDLTISSPSIGGTVSDGTVTWKLHKLNSDGVPIGTILPFSSNGNLPAGYLLCNGAAVSRTMYPDLFSVIGTTYGAGDGENTFNLPDLTDKFIEGATGAGTEKEAGLPNITGELVSNVGPNPGGTAGFRGAYGAFQTSDQRNNFYAETSSGVSSYASALLNASRSSSIYGNSDTVQPPALTMRYVIKAFNGQTNDSALIDITQFAQELANVSKELHSKITDLGDNVFYSNLDALLKTSLARYAVTSGLPFGNGSGSGTIFSSKVSSDRVFQVIMQSGGSFYPNMAYRVIDTANGTVFPWRQQEAIVAKSLGANGYIKYASGLIVQWGTTDDNNPSNVVFPITFPTAILAVVSTTTTGKGSYQDAKSEIAWASLTGFTLYKSGGYGCYWHAIGY